MSRLARHNPDDWDRPLVEADLARKAKREAETKSAIAGTPPTLVPQGYSLSPTSVKD